ncbi:hypothetical protein [Rhizobium giardinii]|uniref:hypothetical protein n=1 Tax=Rhizobium giardinii TaxID=56731 RepID=UPI003D6DCE47
MKSELEQTKRERDAFHRKMEIAQAKVSLMREGFEMLWDFADWWTEEEWQARLIEKEGPQDEDSEPFKAHSSAS